MRKILILILCGLLLTGCGRGENPYQVDTVIRIPVDPTEAPTLPEETALPTEMPTEAPTEAPAEAPTEVQEETQAPEATEEKSGSSGKKPEQTSSGKKPSGGSKEPAKATEPKVTEPKLTEPKLTEPKLTEPPATELPTEAATESPAEKPFDPSGYSVGSLEKTVLQEINRFRQEAGLEELSMSKTLSGIAALRAREAGEVWSHTRPDGRDYSTAMSDYSFSFTVSAENLAHSTGSGDGAAIVAKWMDTDSGRNILNEEFTAAGIGIYRSGDVTFVACLLVG